MEEKKVEKVNKVQQSKEGLAILLRNIKRTLKIYWQIDKKMTLFFFVSVIINSLLPFVTSYYFGVLLNQVVDFLAGKDINTLNILYLFIGLGVLGLFQNILGTYTYYQFRYSRLLWTEHMNFIVTKKFAEMDVSKYEDSEYNNFLNKVKDGHAWRPSEFANTLPYLIANSLVIISSLLIVIRYVPFAVPLLVIAVLPTLFVQIKSSKLAWNIWDTKGEEKKLFNDVSWYLKQRHSVSEIRIFGVKDYFLNFMQRVYGAFMDEQVKVIKVTQKRSFFADSFEIIITLAIEAWLLWKVLDRNSGFSIGNFTFVRNSIERFSSSLNRLTENVSSLYDNNIFMSDLYKFIDMENDIVSKPDAVKIKRTEVPTIEFDNVSFKYPGSDRWIFKNFSIKINPGEDIAIVGENGAGKTTMIKLLCRFYDVTEGRILINGVDIKDIELESWYKQIGVLFQSFNTYGALSVADNIRVGDVDREAGFEEIETAAHKAGAHDSILKYKHTYDQRLSKAYDDGDEPSGGQWQRIALARAFYRNANVLILDEPTSAIDAKGEYEIFKKIAEVQKEKTTIIISHRFSTVKKADKIYVIDEGKILEYGTHEELMKIGNGKYKEMFELQAEGYK